MPLQTVGMDLKIGVERETHRMAPEGRISRLPQPADLIAPFFTKDFAESQLEIVTRPHDSIPALIEELGCLTAWAAEAIDPELLWPLSMPPLLPPEPEIEIANLGTGLRASEGELYRRGLALRYGKARQMICGVHVNVSIGNALRLFLQGHFPLTKTESAGGRLPDALYLRLARNLYEDLPYLILLTGASPLAGGLLAEELPAAVSYRNSRYGYARTEFRPYLNLVSLEGYLAAIRQGLATESERFRKLGLVHRGIPLQLNLRVFQKEKEFYAPIRFKQTPREGESGLRALERLGVEYLELRFLDVDPFSPLGITEKTLQLLHLFILDNLMRPSGPGTREELGRYLDSAEAIAISDPLTLQSSVDRCRKDKGPFRHQAVKRLESLLPLARQLDQGKGSSYEEVVEERIESILNPAKLPSSRLMKASRASGRDWTGFGLQVATSELKGEEYALEYSRI